LLAQEGFTGKLEQHAAKGGGRFVGSHVSFCF
jgi:hypothetical protein